MFPVCSHRCQTARYCSKQCARVAWAGGHKQECRAPFTLTMGPVCARVSLLAGAIVRLLAELGPDVSEEVSALSMAFSVLGRARKVEAHYEVAAGFRFSAVDVSFDGDYVSWLERMWLPMLKADPLAVPEKVRVTLNLA